LSNTLAQVQALVADGQIRLSLHAMVARFRETQDAMTRMRVELVREGKYAAEVSVELIEEEGGWSPYLSLDDARKLDSVKLALRRGDIAEASKYGRVFELMPISA
jgi:hypothetical protein